VRISLAIGDFFGVIEISWLDGSDIRRRSNRAWSTRLVSHLFGCDDANSARYTFDDEEFDGSSLIVHNKTSSRISL